MAPGVQKDEMCIFAAPAHNKKGPSGEGVIKHSDRSCVLTAPAHKKEQQGAGQKDEIYVFAAPAHKKVAHSGRPGQRVNVAFTWGEEGFINKQ